MRCCTGGQQADPFIIEYLEPHGFSGVLTYRDYADAYYHDFFNYTRHRNGDECLIMSRPVDSEQIDALAGAKLVYVPAHVSACVVVCVFACSRNGRSHVLQFAAVPNVMVDRRPQVHS